MNHKEQSGQSTARSKRTDVDKLIDELPPQSSRESRDKVLALIAAEDDPMEAGRLLRRFSKKADIPIANLRSALEWTRERHPSEPQKYEMSEAEREETEALLRSPDLLDQFLSDLDKLGCVGQEREKIILKLACAAGRLSDKPINITLKGQSAVGKNFLLDSVQDTEPPEDVKRITRMTPQALAYFAGQPLKHKLVALAEVHGGEAADYSIRTFQSEKQIRIWTVEKDDKGRNRTIEREVEGPAGFFQTTTKAHLHPENETRFFDLWLDESEEQTKRIHAAQREAHSNPMAEAERQRILLRWQNAARLLKLYPVRIPFPNLIPFPTKPVRVRRDMERFFSLIEASALLHQLQRRRVKRQGKTVLQASLADYEVARKLAPILIKRAATSSKAKRLVEWAKGRRGRFSKSDVDEHMEWTRKTSRKYLHEAIEHGSIAMNGDDLDKSTEFWFVKDFRVSQAPVFPPFADLVRSSLRKRGV